MKKVQRQVGVLMLVLMLAAGCQMSSTQQYKIASDTYSATVETITSLSQMDKIDLDDLERFNDARKVANRILDEMEYHVVANKSFDAQFLLLGLNAAIDEMIRVEVIVKRKAGE